MCVRQLFFHARRCVSTRGNQARRNCRKNFQARGRPFRRPMGRAVRAHCHVDGNETFGTFVSGWNWMALSRVVASTECEGNRGRLRELAKLVKSSVVVAKLPAHRRRKDRAPTQKRARAPKEWVCREERCKGSCGAPRPAPPLPTAAGNSDRLELQGCHRTRWFVDEVHGGNVSRLALGQPAAHHSTTPSPPGNLSRHSGWRWSWSCATKHSRAGTPCRRGGRGSVQGRSRRRRGSRSHPSPPPGFSWATVLAPVPCNDSPRGAWLLPTPQIILPPLLQWRGSRGQVGRSFASAAGRRGVFFCRGLCDHGTWNVCRAHHEISRDGAAR